jgi:hypothetical protein
MLFRGTVCLFSNFRGGPLVGGLIPLVLVGDMLTLQSERSFGDTDRSMGDLLLLGDLLTILMSRLGMIVDLVASFF